MSRSYFDYEEYKKYVNNLGIATSDFRLWLKNFLLQQAQRVVSSAKRRQRAVGAIDTGFMINSWGIGSQSITMKSSIDAFGHTTFSIDPEKSDITSIKLVGNVLEVEIWNGAEYASFIEYGHHSYEGKYLLTISINTVQMVLPSRFNKEFAQFLKSKGVN